jgi:hypothetical protein
MLAEVREGVLLLDGAGEELDGGTVREALHLCREIQPDRGLAS